MFNKTLLLITIFCLALPGYAEKKQCSGVSGLTALRYWDSPTTPYAELERYKRKPSVAIVDSRTVRSHQVQTQVLEGQAKQPELSPKQSSATSKKSKKTVSGASMRHEAALPAASGSAKKGAPETERTQLTAKQALTPSISEAKPAPVKVDPPKVKVVAAKPIQHPTAAAQVQAEPKAPIPVVVKKPAIAKKAVVVMPPKSEPQWKMLQITALPEAHVIPDAGNSWYPKAMQITIDEAIRSRQ